MQVVYWGVLAPLWNRPLVAHNAAFELAFLARPPKGNSILRFLRTRPPFPWGMLGMVTRRCASDTHRPHTTKEHLQ